MQLFWRFKSLPEVKGLTAADQRECLRDCTKAAQRSWQYVVAMGILVVLGITGFLVFQWLAGTALPRILSGGLGGAIGGGLGGAAMAPFILDAVRPHVREWRRARGR